ncbi:MAG: efflux RND transporter permease subunit [Spirochaetes bacterium]|nr:efflux RND transporter permease subunit [Spirochaetota bacterium]
MTLSDMSIRNPVFAWMLMFGLMLFGAICFSRMGVSLMPDVDFPVVSVSVAWRNAAPEIMESQVADIVEAAVSSVEGVEEIASTVQPGIANVSIRFNINRNIDLAMQDVQAKLSQAARILPRDIDPPVVTKTNPEDQPIMFVSLYGDAAVKDIMIYANDFLKDRLSSVDGVGDIFLGGLVPRALRVWLDPAKMAAKDITALDIGSAIVRQHDEVPGGPMETPRSQHNVRTLGEIGDPAMFGDLLIMQRGAQRISVPIALSSVARIEDGLSDLQRISRADGHRAVGFGIRKQRGANTVAVADGIKARVAQLRKGLPAGMMLDVVFDSSAYVKQATAELRNNLVISALLTGIVCWLFLGTFTSTLNVLLAMPTSVLGTFIVLYFSGMTLNTFTLLGLTLAIGIIVDDAIMMLENIVRHRERGANRLTAAVVGAREITFAAVAATLAILAIFIPVVFMQGIIGKFFLHYGITVSVAVGFSLLEALTLTPMRTSQFLRTSGNNIIVRASDAAFHVLARAYTGALEFCLRHRRVVIGIAFAVFAISLFTVPALRKEYVPAQDQSRFTVRFYTPPDSSLAFTDEKIRAAEAFMTNQRAVAHIFIAIGGFQGGQVNQATMFVTMKDRGNRPRGKDGREVTQEQFMMTCRTALNRIPQLRAIVQDPSTQGFSATRGFHVEYSVRGPHWHTLVSNSLLLKSIMQESGLVLDVDSDYQAGAPEINVIPDRIKAQSYGLSIDDIGNTVQAVIGGYRVAQFTENGHRYDIIIRAESRYRTVAADIARSYVRNNSGETIPLIDVVSITQRPALLQITRDNRERAIGLFANIAPGESQSDVLDRLDALFAARLPPGYRAVRSGSSQGFGEAMSGLVAALLLGILISYMVLGSQFVSFIHPLTVLLALPFSAMGAFTALFITNNSLNIYSMIGLILLMGIVKKNSILLVDFTNKRRQAGAAPREALLEACPVRLRPILMTSVATIAAALPPALGIGAGSELRIPMAVTVIGGVFLSTLLTLFVVPCAYSLATWFERYHFLDPGRNIKLPE